jgi:nitrite reductase/ring-hydroxylating ferredoxin subunit
MAEDKKEDGQDGANRREFLGKASRGAMAAGLMGGYGGLGAIALRYLYPARPDELAWQYVAQVDAMEVGEALLYQGPSGETINIARQGRDGGDGDFVALSSTCPHLGCQVRWEAQNDRFFCPCHNGVFDPSGKGIGGPPGDAGQSLAQYPLKVEGGLLHIAVPTTRLADGTEVKGRVLAAGQDPGGPGHDPCLGSTPRRGHCRPAKAPRGV